VRIEIPVTLFRLRRFQPTLGLGAPMNDPVGRGSFDIPLFGGTLAKFAKIDDVAHRDFQSGLNGVPPLCRYHLDSSRNREAVKLKPKVFPAAAQYTLR
jgi:hypothetical protein